MPYKYNQLLKLNLQKDADISGIEADIDDLKQKKVTKFFSATDTLEDGEIAHYQGANDEGNNLINGYFYKVDVLPQRIIPANTPYIYLNADFISDVFNVIANDKYYLIEQNVLTTDSFAHSQQTSPGVCPYHYIQPPTVGNPVYFQTEKEWHLITSYQNYRIYCGETGFYYGGQIDGPFSFDKYVNKDGQIILVNNTVALCCFIYQHNGLNYGIAPQFLNPVIYIYKGTTTDPVVLGGNQFTRVNTQPQTPGITEESGKLKVSMPVEFEDDVTVKGTQTVVTTEQIQSEKDFVKLRYNNPLALASGDVSGISVENYDGNATNCLLAVDKDGWARIGDSTGTLEKIATIEENPTDGDFVQYDAQNKQLKTATIPEATTLQAGLMSAKNYNKINLIYQNGDGTQNLTAAFILDIVTDVLNKGFIQSTVIATIVTNNSYCTGLINVFLSYNRKFGSILLTGYNFFKVVLISDSVVDIYDINKTLT